MPLNHCELKAKVIYIVYVNMKVTSWLLHFVPATSTIIKLYKIT